MTKEKTPPLFGTRSDGSSLLLDRRRGSLYDRVRLHGGVPVQNPIRCFQKSVQLNREWADTNMVLDGQLSSPVDMLVERFLWLFQPTTHDRDIKTFLHCHVWEFQLGQKTLVREPLLSVAVSGRMEDLIEEFGKPRIPGQDEPAVLRRFAWPYCHPLRKDEDKGDHRIYIPPLFCFQMRMVSDVPFVPEGDMDFYAIIDGLQDRPVT